MRRGKVRTGSGVQAEVGASELDGSGTAVDDPVLRTSAVAVVADWMSEAIYGFVDN